MGQQLFEPPDVAGWERGPAWFTTAAMLARMNFAATLASAAAQRHRRGRDGQRPHAGGAAVVLSGPDSPAPFEQHARNCLLDYLRGGTPWTGNATSFA
jgi:hypothetical protein